MQLSGGSFIGQCQKLNFLPQQQIFMLPKVSPFFWAAQQHGFACKFILPVCV
jgi:hypothetical protein